MNYDFSTLNDKDLEELARDLLSKKLLLDFQSFKIGRDKGIDLRYATNSNENEIIVQVKHYIGSKFSNLKSVLKNEEYNKIKILNPKRYIIVTSLSLSASEKETIKEIVKPYIQITSDIFSKEDLNVLISEFPAIEDKYYKLWLTSTNILKRILKNGLKGRSEFAETEIKNKIKLFVINKEYESAVNILNSKNFILITGEPGIGKTMLANMLTFEFLAENFELVYVTDVKEAEEAYENKKKQIFYFDDFLGTITLDLTSSRNIDASIVNFITRIKNDKQKRLILTCRTTILNQAKEASEKIYNSKIDIANHEIKISHYGNLEKAKILYNHIFFSNLPIELKNIFFENEFYWKVIRHRNYNPRLIEFFTDIERIENTKSYEDEIISFLDNPEKIWEKSFEIQISEFSRIFLSTMFSLSGYYTISDYSLIKAFNNRIEYEIHLNNLAKPLNNIYEKTVKELLNAFIKRVITKYENFDSFEYRFFNPSLQDFLVYYFNNKNFNAYFSVLKSAVYIEQFKNNISTKPDEIKKIHFVGENYYNLLNLFIEKYPNLYSFSNIIEFDIIICLIRLFKWNDIEQIVLKKLSEYEYESLEWIDKLNLIEILKYFAENKLTQLIPISIKKIFIKLTENVHNHYFLSEISYLYSYQEYYEVINEMKQNDKQLFKNYSENINTFWQSEMHKFIFDDSSIKKIDNEIDLKKFVRNKKKEIIKINRSLNLQNFKPIKNQHFNVEKQLIANIKMKEEKNIEIGYLNKLKMQTDENIEVDRLFNNEKSINHSDVPF